MKNIKWLEWSTEAFEKAKQEDKPILLDIYGVWCHWCHQMEKTYSDEIVIETVNEKFVPIRVDTDKRPDINERYNQGGWPTTAFLTPDGMLITGATYLPPTEMVMMLEHVSNYYKRTKNQTEFHTEKPKIEKGEIKSVIDDVVEEMLLSFDTTYGGFGHQPKFPFPDAIELALLKFRQTNDKSFLRIATKTLDGMLGIFDDIEGGFYRYSVTREWNLPHYEKMLETNSQLILNYIHAFQISEDERYKSIAEKTAEFLITILHGPYGFYGSQDADEEEDYYGKSLEERKKMLQPFIDKNIYINLNALAISAFLQLGEKYKNIATDTIENLWNKCFDKERGMCHYYDGRQNIFGLLVDNVYFVRCLLDAYEVTANNDYLEKAQHLMDLTMKHFFDNGFNDKIKNKDDIGMLSIQNKNMRENAAASECLVRLAFYSGKKKYRDLAENTLSIFVSSYKNYGIHAAAYALSVEIFLDSVEITAPAKLELIFDPRVMVKFGLENKIYVCRNNICRHFDSVEEAKQFIEAVR